MENQFDWYDLWLKQSNVFFSSAEKNLKDLFQNNNFVNPEDHLDKINLWLEDLKKRWEFFQASQEQQAAYQDYWKMMTQMTMDACDLMLKQWKKRSENNPIKTMQELYELWLNCCREIYQTNLQSKKR